MNLYEINAQIDALLNVDGDQVIDMETGEVISVARALDELEIDRKTKMENIAMYIANLEAEAAAIKERESAFYERRKSKERKIESLKQYLIGGMEAYGRNKFETANIVVTMKTNEKTEVADIDAVPDEFCKFEKNAILGEIKKAIHAGQTVPGAAIVEHKTISVK